MRFTTTEGQCGGGGGGTNTAGDGARLPPPAAASIADRLLFEPHGTLPIDEPTVVWGGMYQRAFGKITPLASFCTPTPQYSTPRVWCPPGGGMSPTDDAALPGRAPPSDLPKVSTYRDRTDVLARGIANLLPGALGGGGPASVLGAWGPVVGGGGCCPSPLPGPVRLGCVLWVCCGVCMCVLYYVACLWFVVIHTQHSTYTQDPHPYHHQHPLYTTTPT